MAAAASAMSPPLRWFELVDVQNSCWVVCLFGRVFVGVGGVGRVWNGEGWDVCGMPSLIHRSIRPELTCPRRCSVASILGWCWVN